MWNLAEWENHIKGLAEELKTNQTTTARKILRLGLMLCPIPQQMRNILISLDYCLCMGNFEQCVDEMLDLVTKMIGDAPLDTNRYKIMLGFGVRDNDTGVMLLANDGLVGTLGEVVHPQIDSEELKKRILNLGYKVKGSDDNSVSYVLGNSRYKELPDVIAVTRSGKGIGSYELYTRDRKKVLTPLKTLLEYLKTADF